jgi:ribosomal-protein-alanine N-acetyltransferase
MILRTMRWWDIEPAVEIEHALFEHSPWSAEQFWSELALVPDTRWYVVHDGDGGIDAYAGLFSLPPEGEVQTIAVAADAQGRGLGRELLAALIDEARRRSCTTLMLEVLHDNLPAISLYESVGFEVFGRRRDYYGPGAHAVLMRMRLSEVAP